jgi:hypothetical protein
MVLNHHYFNSFFLIKYSFNVRWITPKSDFILHYRVTTGQVKWLVCATLTHMVIILATCYIPLNWSIIWTSIVFCIYWFSMYFSLFCIIYGYCGVLFISNSIFIVLVRGLLHSNKSFIFCERQLGSLLCRNGQLFNEKFWHWCHRRILSVLVSYLLEEYRLHNEKQRPQDQLLGSFMSCWLHSTVMVWFAIQPYSVS